MSTVSESVIKRIRALLAMSRGNANENEAAVAAQKVQEMLTAFNLSIADVEQRDARGNVIEDSELMTSSSQPWRRDLALATARLYMCDYYWQHVKHRSYTRKTGYIRADRHNFIGLAHNVVVAKEMFVYLVDTVERLAKEARKVGKKRGTEIDGTWAEYENAFRYGCATRLRDRIWARYYEQTTPPAGLVTKSNVPALYKGMAAEVDDFMKKNHTDLTVKKSRGKHSSIAGVIDGDEAGKLIGLDDQLQQEEKPRAIGSR